MLGFFKTGIIYIGSAVCWLEVHVDTSTYTCGLIPGENMALYFLFRDTKLC